MTAAILADEKRSGAGRKDSRKYGVPEPLIPAREKSFPEYRRRLRHCPEAAKDNNAQARFPYRPDRHWPRQTWYRARKTRQAAKAAGPAPREDVFPAFCTSRPGESRAIAPNQFMRLPCRRIRLSGLALAISPLIQKFLARYSRHHQEKT